MAASISCRRVSSPRVEDRISAFPTWGPSPSGYLHVERLLNYCTVRRADSPDDSGIRLSPGGAAANSDDRLARPCRRGASHRRVDPFDVDELHGHHPPRRRHQARPLPPPGMSTPHAVDPRLPGRSSRGGRPQPLATFPADGPDALRYRQRSGHEQGSGTMTMPTRCEAVRGTIGAPQLVVRDEAAAREGWSPFSWWPWPPQPPWWRRHRPPFPLAPRSPDRGDGGGRSGHDVGDGELDTGSRRRHHGHRLRLHALRRTDGTPGEPQLRVDRDIGTLGGIPPFGTSYTFTVVATSASGPSGPSAHSNAVVPTAFAKVPSSTVVSGVLSQYIEVAHPTVTYVPVLSAQSESDGRGGSFTAVVGESTAGVATSTGQLVFFFHDGMLVGLDSAVEKYHGDGVGSHRNRILPRPLHHVGRIHDHPGDLHVERHIVRRRRHASG